jgi:hypothetical protein
LFARLFRFPLKASLSKRISSVSKYWYECRNESYSVTYEDDEGNEEDALDEKGLPIWKEIIIPNEAGEYIDASLLGHYESQIRKKETEEFPIDQNKIKKLNAALKRRDESVKKLREAISNMSSP